MMVPTTLFKSVRSSSHEQSDPTCMNKPVNNTVQAGQLNHVQAGQLNHVQAGQLIHVQAGQLNHVQAGQRNHVQAGQLNHAKAVNRQKQPVIFSTLAAYLLDYIPLSSDRQMPY